MVESFTQIRLVTEMNFGLEYSKKREKKREKIGIQTAWEVCIQLRQNIFVHKPQYKKKFQYN
jgi:hypothetical protein